MRLHSAMIIGAAGDGESELAGQPEIAERARRPVVTVINLQAQQPLVHQAANRMFFVERIVNRESDGMGQHGNAASVANASDHLEEVRLFHGHISGRVLADVAGEGLIQVGYVALVAKELGEVKASGDRPADRFRLLEVDFEIEFAETRGELAVAFAAALLDLVDAGLERGGRRSVEEISQQVDRLLIIKAGRDLDAADEFDRGGARRINGGEVTGQRVVISDRDGAEPEGSGFRDQLGG